MLTLLHGEAIGGNVINGFLQIVCAPDYRKMNGLKHVTAYLSSDSVVRRLFIDSSVRPVDMAIYCNR